MFQIAIQTYHKIAKFKIAGSKEGDHATQTNFLPIDSFKINWCKTLHTYIQLASLLSWAF